MQTRLHLRPATVVSYRYLTGLAVADLGRLRLDQLDVHAVAVWLSGMHSRDSLSPSTAVRAYRMLSQVLGYAVKAKRSSENPCVVTGAGVTAKRDLNVPTVAEALAMADSMPARLRALVIVWASCGLRFGETLGLQRGDVDLKNRTLRIQRQVTEAQGTQRVAELKTGAGRRTIDLPQMVVTALEEHLDRWVDEDPGTFLFTGPRGGIQRRKGVYAEWWKARQRLGLEGVRIHDLRHLSGTLGAISGATPKEQMARMGHADSRMALHYQHIVAGRGRTIADGIDKLVQMTEQLEAEAD